MFITSTRRRRPAAAAAVALFAGISLAVVASAQPDLTPKPAVLPTEKAPAAEAPAAITGNVTTPPALTAADVGAWLDGFMPNSLRQFDIAGAVVVVVKGGQVLVERGYGFADVAKQRPMDPEHTLVRPGSVSKLFTWTAVMQLVEQHKLDLDADVNQYLDFKIPAYDGKPVTLRDIMTHTAGFEETLKHLILFEGADMPRFEELIKEYVPARIYAPGTTPAYSNYATAVAGYIVERVSGEPFEDYIAHHIFTPLGMQHSTFRQPLPVDWKPQMSNGYQYGSLPAKTFELVGPLPAGSLSTTAADMARFMIAHLQDGKLGDAQILEPQTAQMMHTTVHTVLPHVDNMLLGFYQANRNGHRGIAHGGDTEYFHSDLHLLIDDGVGVFVSFNSPGKDTAVHPLRSTMYEEFVDRYFPAPPSQPTRVDDKTARQHAAMIAGHYQNSRRVETKFMSLLNLASEVKVEDRGDGSISLSMAKSPTGTPYRWIEIAPFLWQQEHEQTLLSAEAKDGKVVRFSFGEYAPIMMFERPSPWKASVWLLPAFCVALAALLLTTLAWPISAVIRRHYRLRPALAGEDAQAQRWLRLVALATVVVWAGWIGLEIAMLSDLSMLAPKTDIWLWLLQFAGLIVFVLGTILGLRAAWLTLRGRRRGLAKGWAALLAASLLISLWTAFAFHLLSFGVRY
jgi:CubicO group peptidase (beta-lactamase class C family)